MKLIRLHLVLQYACRPVPRKAVAQRGDCRLAGGCNVRATFSLAPRAPCQHQTGRGTCYFVCCLRYGLFGARAISGVGSFYSAASPHGGRWGQRNRPRMPLGGDEAPRRSALSVFPPLSASSCGSGKGFREKIPGVFVDGARRLLPGCCVVIEYVPSGRRWAVASGGAVQALVADT